MLIVISAINKSPPSPEEAVFDEFLTRTRLRKSSQRRAILRVFLELERHVTAEELHAEVRGKHPEIGVATVHRSLKLFTECGLAREVRLGSRRTYYEHSYRHGHHDHLVCTGCGRTVEFVDPTIEKRQEDAARRHGFLITSHSLELFGLCAACRKGRR